MTTRRHRQMEGFTDCCLWCRVPLDSSTRVYELCRSCADDALSRLTGPLRGDEPKAVRDQRASGQRVATRRIKVEDLDANGSTP